MLSEVPKTHDGMTFFSRLGHVSSTFRNDDIWMKTNVRNYKVY